MKVLLATATSMLLATAAFAQDPGIASSADKGNKTGWVDHVDGNGNPTGATSTSRVPKGLTVSGENGRVDNGKGNGGENVTAPNNNGEDAAADKDPN